MQKIKKEVPTAAKEPERLPRIDRGDRPTVELTSENGNVYNLIGVVSKALKRSGFKQHAKEMEERCLHAGDYDEVLRIFQEYAIIE